MAWRRPGDKPLSDPMMVSLLTHICVTRPQWINNVSCMMKVWFVSSRWNWSIAELYAMSCNNRSRYTWPDCTSMERKKTTFSAANDENVSNITFPQQCWWRNGITVTHICIYQENAGVTGLHNGYYHSSLVKAYTAQSTFRKFFTNGRC